MQHLLTFTIIKNDFHNLHKFLHRMTAMSGSSQTGAGVTWMSMKRICGIFCCPPCPSKIASKLAFLPPEPSYDIIDEPISDNKVFLIVLD